MGRILNLGETVALLHPAGERFEVRLLHCRADGTVAGVFDDPTQVARAVAQYDGVAEGCYITLNPLGSAVAVANRLTPNAATTAADDQVDRRRWLLLDFDPDRCDPITGAILYQTTPDGKPVLSRDDKPKKLICPSTDAELAKALARRDEAAIFFAGRGWPRPLKGMSANGGHLLYALDLPNDDEAVDLVSWVLKATAKHFTGDGVDVDLTVFNASRITKLYGTLAKKGKATADRPYRRAYLEAPDGPVEVVAAELLQVFAGEVRPKPRPAAPKPVEARADTPTTGATVAPGEPGRYDLDRLKEKADIVTVAEALGLKPEKSGRKNYVAYCPAHPDAPGPGKRPNLSLNSEKGAICFSCGFKAGAVDLVMKVRNCDAGEAIRWLAALVNLAPEAPAGEGSRGKHGLGYKPKGKTDTAYPKGAPLTDAARLAPAPDPVTPTEAVASVGEEAPQVFTLIWPADANPVTMGGKWRRLDDGSVEAAYTRDELAVALWVMGSAVEGAFLLHALGEAPATSPRATTRVEVYDALLKLCRPIMTTDPNPPPGAVFLRDVKGLSLATQEAAGLHWLDDWAKADRELKATFGADVLKGLGMLTDKGKLHFERHRLIFPFWLKVGDRLAPVYAQGRNVAAQTKNERFDNPSESAPCPYNYEAVKTARALGRPVFVCEGATDTLSLTQSGRLACGIPGTLGFKPAWAKHFAGLDVYFAFDPDAAGQEAARKYAAVFVAEGLPAPKVVRLPEGQDVTDFFTGKATKNPSDNTPLSEERERTKRP